MHGHQGVASALLAALPEEKVIEYLKIKSSGGWTAMHMAVYNKQQDLEILLIKAIKKISDKKAVIEYL